MSRSPVPRVPGPIARLIESWPPESWRAHRAVVAVSGGADSTALLLAVSELHRWTGAAPAIVVAHVNHQLRGDDSLEDQRFVEELSRSACGQLARDAIDPRRWEASSDGLEAAAREARLEFFRQVAADVGARYVLTAHTADDVAETLLFRLLRGTGVDGLATIPPVRLLAPDVTLVRPWLGLRPAPEILSFSPNATNPFGTMRAMTRPLTRNRIRHELLPLMHDVMGRDVTESLVRLSEQARAMVDMRVAWEANLPVSPTPEADSESASFTLERERMRCVARQAVADWLRSVARARGWQLGDWDAADWRRWTAQCLEAEPRVWTYPGGLRVEAKGGVLEVSRVSV
ncbi:MAG: tRNA lysidine(34) synthetase TilS [Pirellulaceae bacterium]